jgi:phage terminase small subunit
MRKPNINKRKLGDMTPTGAKAELPEWSKELNIRQLRFVEEYMIDLNGRQAAMRAGFANTSHRGGEIARRMLAEPEVVRALDGIFNERMQVRIALKRKMMDELAALSFYDVSDYITVRKNTVTIKDLTTLTEDQRKAVKRYKQTKGKTNCTEIEFHDKVKAIELLDRMNGGGHGMTINTNVATGIKVNVTPEEAEIA